MNYLEPHSVEPLPLVWASVAASVKCIVLTYVDH